MTETRKWGDDPVDGEEEGARVDELPKPYETEPDENGVKQVVRFEEKQDGTRVKITRTVQVQKRTTYVKKAVLERRQWKKFGDVAGAGRGLEEGVTTLGDEVRLERTKDEKRKKETTKAPTKGSGLGIVCRLCKMVGDHFTLKCPYRDQLGGMPMDDGPPLERDDAPSGRSRFVVPAKRAGGSMAGESMRSRDDTATIRVTNLPEDITEGELGDLFARYGRVERIYLAKDKVTGLSKGFAFINFSIRRDAEVAMEELQGHGVDHMILRLEWARPSNRD